MKPQPCPCGSGQTLAACCGRYHAGLAAPDAASLMRARYSAYVLGDVTFLLASWHPETRPDALTPDDVAGCKWIGLKVLDPPSQTTDAQVAQVEFIARYRIGGRAHRLHERSRFRREEGRWYYLDGEINPAG